MRNCLCYPRPVRNGARLLPLALAVLLSAPLAAQEIAEAPYLFTLGKILLDEGAYTEAGENFAQAVEEVPDDAYLRLEYADYLMDAGQLDEAADQLAAARDLAPGDPQILKAFGQLQLQAARENDAAFSEAREAFEKLRDKTPGDLEAMSTLGRIYLSEQRFEDATGVFRQALGYWPQNRALHGSLIDALLRVGATAEAEQAILEFLRIDAASVRARLTLADLQQRRGDPEAAGRTLVETPRDSPGDAELFRQLAVALYEYDLFADALFWLDRGLELQRADPVLDPQGVFLRALLLTGTERNAEARAELERLIEAQPDRLDVLQLLTHHMLGGSEWQAAADLLAPRLEGELDEPRADLALLLAQSLRRLDRTDEALDWLARAAAVPEVRVRALARQAEMLLGLDRAAEADELLAELTASDDREALLLAAEVCQREQDFARSVPFLERLTAAGHEDLQVLFWLGAAYERTGRQPEAENQFRRFLEREPDSAPALNYLGYMFADAGANLPEALELIERAVELDPDNGAYVDSLGWAHFRLGNYQEARTHLERAAELVGDDAVVLEHLGEVYEVLGERDGAIALYRRALALEAENADELRAKLEQLGQP